MFPFWAPGLFGWAALTKKAGLHWPPFAAKAAPITKLLSCFVFGRLGGWVVHGKRLGSPSVPFMFAFWVPGWDGWAPFSSLHWDGWAAAKGLGTRWTYWVGWVVCGRLPLGSVHVSFLGSSGLLGRDGWAAAKKLGSHWAPFILFGLLGGWVGRGQELGGRVGRGKEASCFLSGLLGRMGGPRPRSSDGWAAAKKLGSRWAPFIFFLGPGSDGRQKSWAPIELPSYFFLGSWVWVSLAPFMFPSFWALGRMGGPQEAGLPLGSLQCFLLSGSGSDGRQRSFAPFPFIFPFWAPESDRSQGWAFVWAAVTKLPSCFSIGLFAAPITLPGFRALGLDGWSTAKRLGSPSVPFMFAFWVPGWDGWAPSYFLSGQGAGLPLTSLHVSFWAPGVGWVGRGPFPSFWVLGRTGSFSSLHISFLGSWVGWVGRGQEAGLALGSLHPFWAPGSDGWSARPRSWLPLGSVHVSFLGSWVGWVAKKLGSH